jgi:hypothetical protein
MSLDVDTLMNGFDKTVETIAGQIDRVFDKQWEARAEVIRNVVGVASVIFAGTVAFLEKDPPHSNTLEGACLVSSWLLLLASIAAGLYVLWKLIALRSTHAMLVNQKPYIQSQFSTLNLNAPDVVEQSIVIVRKVADGMTQRMGDADKRARVGSGVCMIAFGASMVSFLIYALAKVGLFSP